MCDLIKLFGRTFLFLSSEENLGQLEYFIEIVLLGNRVKLFVPDSLVHLCVCI